MRSPCPKAAESLLIEDNPADAGMMMKSRKRAMRRNATVGSGSVQGIDTLPCREAYIPAARHLPGR